MEHQTLENLILEIMCQVFKVDNPKNIAFGSSDCWDSLSHMDLVTSLEHRFQIEFDEEQILSLTDFNSISAVLKKYGSIP